MNNNSIFFIAYQDQENLGIGYLSSMLATHNYEVDIINIRSERRHEEMKTLDLAALEHEAQLRLIESLEDIDSKEKLDVEQLWNVIFETMNSLQFSETLKRAFVLRYRDELTIKNISETLGINYSTLSKMLHRARIAIRDELRKRGIDRSDQR